ncbi:MAG TPA: hypothetical protein IAC66_03485 [Candidatus Aphodousia gallistercoris]|nr:hypothetical protein [Candidatus Aphodousia gallistercoris]
MLDVRDENGRTVIVPVAFNAKGRHATINLVKTAFGRENDLWFPLQEQQDLLVYANQEKINRWNESSGPKSLWGSNDSEISVLIEKDHVNEKLKYAGMYQGARGSFNPALNQITLTPNANISTYSHEMAHRYLSNLFELSKCVRAESTLKEDAQTLLKEFGVKSVEDWDKLGIEGQRKFQEQFTSWTEIYLAEGRAPKPALQRLFEPIGLLTYIESLAA